MGRKPNVILISTDQQRGDCIGPEGRGVRTPNIDRLAERGGRFTNCITPHPMCQAARASILTGKLPYSHGVRDNGRDLDPAFAEEGLAGIFARAGYETRFIGKAHFSSQQTFEPTGKPECYDSAKDYPKEWNGEYFGFEKVEMMLRPHHHTRWYEPPQALHYEYWLDEDGKGKQRWDRAKDALEPQTAHFQAWRSALEEEWHSTPWVGERTLSMLEEERDRPLFAWVSFPDPHPPFLAPKPWCDMYDPAEVQIARHPELDLEKRPWWHKAFLDERARNTLGAEHNSGGVDWGKKGELSTEALRDITAIYFGMISAVDHQVGRIVEKLEAAGELDNTIIIFISDHGEWLGDHGLLLKGPMLYDGLLRVPGIIAGPGVPQGRVIDDPVSTIDVRATLAELCSLEAAPDHGKSWIPLLEGRETREFALCEYEVDARRSGVDLDLMTVRTKTHRMSVDLRTDTGELYDIKNDPDEMNNLFDDPNAQSVRKELMSMIKSRPADQIPVAPRVGWH
ncbi:sulfatase family protein [Nitratireductor sp. CH_MIT9313-5]|uniref:sulfatase family protein n=1 Tax=Nitratireductor sp. CH_MIT9313-5 TaxID=3107764 RepID=UPI00300ADA04